jgi:nucleoside 2-deoxyribosyltransferase
MPKKIVICGSIDFTDKFKEISDELVKKGFEVILPVTSEDLLQGKVTREQLLEEANSLEGYKRKIEGNVIKEYYDKIADSYAVLVVNMAKKGVEGYIGGNTFLEMGFAHVLNKPIFVYNELPIMAYTDELKALKTEVIYGDLERIA